MSGQPLEETPADRRNRLLRAGKEAAEGIARDAYIDLHEGEASTRADLLSVVKRACLGAYELGVETMGDIATPQVAEAEISETETRLECAHDVAAMARIRRLSPETTTLAINGVIRLLVERNTNRTLSRWPARAELPVEECTALAAVVEAALGLNTQQLVESGLFPSLP